MSILRPLLRRGNSKLGEAVYAWSLPAYRTCPGKTPLCVSHCYALRGRFRTGSVERLLAGNLAASMRRDFVPRMVREIDRRYVRVCRIHVSGDFYSPAYCRKWLEIVRLSPGTIFYAYTRSWRVAKLRPLIEELAGLPNLRLWYSADRDAAPESTPAGVRVAWMQDEEEGEVRADLVFPVRRLRGRPRGRIGLAVVCPHDTESGKLEEVTCTSCRVCWS